MATATLIESDWGGCPGPAQVYELDPPLAEHRRVLVDGKWSTSLHSRVVIWMQPGFGSMGPCVKVVPLRTSEAAALNVEMPGSYALQHEVSIDEAAWWALQTAGGYEIVNPEVPPNVVEPELFERVMRVYEVAYKLEVPSARVIEALEALGVEGKTPNSNVDPVDAVRVRDYLNEVT
ncbi:translation initiation factor IF-2 N-terminal domain-containing protein [Rhodococcus erythropolis]|uniref:translation initiation factor IF-2 N-terminal domain-containing protein n=1 Tax=Rhodococcus erythropolis TaxID=1833 RepID=UPI001BE91FA3|nr:translation initiation factor IF-2 N-terminal domain-containing protein [Rhodococcus erythropolis]MBT2266466.1 translation initiation factor IF-2 N-terminal domain-containing protein [Rhodococcus erythropolis]